MLCLNITSPVDLPVMSPRQLNGIKQFINRRQVVWVSIAVNTRPPADNPLFVNHEERNLRDTYGRHNVIRPNRCAAGIRQRRESDFVSFSKHFVDCHRLVTDGDDFCIEGFNGVVVTT